MSASDYDHELYEAIVGNSMFKIDWLRPTMGAKGLYDLVVETTVQNSSTLQNAINEATADWRSPRFSEMPGFRIMQDGKQVYRSPERKSSRPAIRPQSSHDQG
jgi:hypothetical protein